MIVCKTVLSKYKEVNPPHYYEYYESHIARFINEIDGVIDSRITKINFDNNLFFDSQ